MVGNLKHNGSASAFDSVMAMADKINAERFYLPGPVFTNSREELRKLLKQPIYRNILKISETADVAFVAIAGIDLDAPTLVDCFITEVEARELLKQGAVGEILCNFFNVEGKLIDHELNDRNTSVKLKNQTYFSYNLHLRWKHQTPIIECPHSMGGGSAPSSQMSTPQTL